MADKEASKGGGHKATYARDNRSGAYLIRVTGPHSNKFAGKEIPVGRMDGTVGKEKVTKIVWSGVNDDPEKGPVGPVTLYRFEPRPRDEEEVEF
jgi:hypothetical protein